MTESNRGILTEADREFLEKKHQQRLDDYSRSAISQRWDAIRRRVYYGVDDLELLFYRLPQKHRQRVFEQYEEGLLVHKRSQLLRCSTAFLFLGVAEVENIELDDNEFYSHLFRNVIETALHRVGRGAERIDVDVTIEGWHNPDEGIAGADLSELTEQQLRYLLFDGQISNKEFAEAVLDPTASE